MPDSLLSRVTPADLEIRGDGRTVYGVFVPFDREATVNDGYGPYREVFRPGSLARSINSGRKIPFLVNHDRQRLPIGSSLSLREDPVGGVGEFRVSKTREGDEVIELVRDGALGAFSVGFAPVKDRQRGDLVERTEVKLREVSIVAFPAYEDALVGGVRHQDDPDLLARIEELERLLALATDLRTPTEEPAHEGTSDGDSRERTEEPAHEGTSDGTPNRDALRFALKAFAATHGGINR